MKASNHFILTRSLSAAGQIGCGLFGQSRLSLENCFRIFNKRLHRRNRKFNLITSCEFDFWIHLSSCYVFGVILI